jgi:hypothetical protein
MLRGKRLEIDREPPKAMLDFFERLAAACALRRRIAIIASAASFPPASRGRQSAIVFMKTSRRTKVAQSRAQTDRPSVASLSRLLKPSFG